jgi:hypothetical protein
MLELIISYFLTKFNIITKKLNNPDCHLNHSVSMEEPNGLDDIYFNEISHLVRYEIIYPVICEIEN